MTPDDIKKQLKLVKYPGFSRDIVSFGIVHSIDLKEDTAYITLALTSADPKVGEFLKKEVEHCLAALPEIKKVVVEVSAAAPGANIPARSAPPPPPPPPITYSVAIASGKGGVGKSTFASNLACAIARILEKQGRCNRVGLMDCDIYGPSIPLMMGIREQIYLEDEKIIPPKKHGVKVMSMGFLVSDDTPVAWRGPMIMRTVQQFVQNVKWGELDVLLIDLPPGTGDAQLSLVQTLPLDGALLVTTPQIAASNVARKGGLMFNKVNVPLLGVVENMSAFVDPAGNTHYLFGRGGGKKIADDLNTELFAELPLYPQIRESADAGQPIVISEPDSPAARIFETVADKLLGKLAAGPR